MKKQLIYAVIYLVLGLAAMLITSILVKVIRKVK